jgi:hypothetical protein
MPTTNQEANDIIAVISKYLPVDKARELAVELDEQIGARTENDSLRTTLGMLRKLLENNPFAYSPNMRTSVHSIKGKSGLHTYGDKS